MNVATQIRICILISICLFYETYSDSVVFQGPVNNAPVRPASYGLRESTKRSVIFRDQSAPIVRRDPLAPPRFIRPTTSDFRPSRSLIFPDNQAANGQLTPAAAGLNVHLPPTEQRPQKALNFVPSPADEFGVTSQTLETKPATSPASKELVSAMELLVEKISTLEKKFQSNPAEQAQPIDVRENSIVPELVDTLEELMERTHSLEQRLQNLEAVAADWRNAKVELATTTTTTTTTTTKPTAITKKLRECPDQFFIFENTTADSPCYYVSSTENKRNNWGEAASSCHKLGAQLVEPKTSTELQMMAELLLALTDRVGGNYWTGGINPGLLWMWTSIIRPLDNIPSDLWVSPTERNEYATEGDGKCLSLAYDKQLHRYALQGFECQKYLYYICEYDDSTVTSRQLDHIPKSLNSTISATTTAVPSTNLPSKLAIALKTRPPPTTTTKPTTTTTQTTTTPISTTTTTTSTTTPRSISRLPTRITSRIPSRITTRLPVRSSTLTAFTLKPLRFTRRTTQTSTATTKAPPADDAITTFNPVQANYIGVIGFKGVGPTAEANLTIFQ